MATVTWVKSALPHYSPKWLSNFFEFLNRLPVPFWLLGLIYTAVLAIIRHVIAWNNGILPSGQLNTFLTVNPLFSIAIIVAWQILDHRALRALKTFFSESGKTRQRAQTEKEFLSLPAIPALIFFVLGVPAGYYNFVDTAQLEPVAAQVLPLITILGFALTFSFSFLLIFRIFHQVRMMQNLFNTIEADIFNPQSIYALSRYGAFFGLTLFVAYTLPTLPLLESTSTNGWIWLLVASFAIVIVFFAPLVQINARMRATKDRLLAQVGTDLRGIQTRIHKAVARQRFSEVDKMSGSLTALREERELIQKIPTWPWQPDTLRNVFTPMLVPILVYLISRFLGGLVGLK